MTCDSFEITKRLFFQLCVAFTDERHNLFLLYAHGKMINRTALQNMQNEIQG